MIGDLKIHGRQDTKWLIRSLKSKDGEYKVQMDKQRSTKHCTQKTKY